MACMTCIVRGSFVNRGGHDTYEGFEQFLDILNIKNILNGNGCLGGYGFHRRDDIGRKCADIPRCIHSVDELDHAKALSLPVVHGDYQHGLGVISGHGIITDRTGEIVLRGSPHIFNADRPVFQITHGTDIFPAQLNRRKIWFLSISSLIGVHGIVAHDFEAQHIPVCQIKRSGIGMGQFHDPV